MPETLYLLPLVTIRLPDDPEQPGREFYEAGPKYFSGWSDTYPASIPDSVWSQIPYGYGAVCLLAVTDILPASATFLAAQADVYEFDLGNLDAQLGPDRDTLIALLEGFNLPTNWTTPSTSYRELLRYLGGIYDFNRRWWVKHIRATGLQGDLFDFVGMDDKWNSLLQSGKDAFEAVLADAGFPQGVSGNPTMRSLVRQGGSYFEQQELRLGGLVI